MKRKSFTNFIIVFSLLLGLYLANTFFRLQLGAKISIVIKPVATVVSELGSNVNGFFTNFGRIGKLQTENKELTSKLNQALVEIARLNEDEKENLALKRDLGFRISSGFNLLAANVISFDPGNVRNTITINKGKNDGLKDNDVVVSEGFLVGKVTDCQNQTAKIKLINDSESAIPAAISGGSIQGIVKGSIGSGITLEQVPQSDKVNMGDMIVTSGLGGEYPKGLIFGKVDEIQKVSGSIFQLITVRPMVDLTKLERVMVIK